MRAPREVSDVARYALSAAIWAVIASALAMLACLTEALDSSNHPAWRIAAAVAALCWAFVSVTSFIKAVTLTAIIRTPPPVQPTQIRKDPHRDYPA